MIDAYEFVVVSGPVDGPRDCARLSAEMDDYGEDGYRVVSSSTVVSNGRPFATFVLEREALEDEPPGAELRPINGGVS